MKKNISLALLIAFVFSFHTSCETFSDLWDEDPENTLWLIGVGVGLGGRLISRIVEPRSTRLARVFDGVAAAGFVTMAVATGQEFDVPLFLESGWEDYPITFLNDTTSPVFVRGPGISREQVPVRGWAYRQLSPGHWQRSEREEPGELILPNRNRSRRAQHFEFEYNATLVEWEELDSRTIMFFERDIEDYFFFDDTTVIGYGEFADEQLIDVPIHDLITIIEAGAYRDSQLEYVVIPYGTISIGERAFAGNRLVCVTFPGSVIYIESGAFSRNQLINVNIPDSVTYLGSWAFSQNQLTSIAIPDSVTDIRDYAFINNRLTSVTIPDSITHIGIWAFAINRLACVFIPDSVVSIGIWAFYANQITSISIGENVEVGDNAFGSGFEQFYEANERRAGTYTLYNDHWAFQPR